MKLWIDDIRPSPDATWTVAVSYDEAIQLLQKHNFEVVSFDHDLGQTGYDLGQTGYDIAKWLELRCWTGQPGHLTRIRWGIHSANPVGRKNIEAAMLSCDKYWDDKGIE